MTRRKTSSVPGSKMCKKMASTHSEKNRVRRFFPGPSLSWLKGPGPDREGSLLVSPPGWPRVPHSLWPAGPIIVGVCRTVVHPRGATEGGQRINRSLTLIVDYPVPHRRCNTNYESAFEEFQLDRFSFSSPYKQKLTEHNTFRLSE